MAGVDEGSGQKQALKSKLTEANALEMSLEVKVEEMIGSESGSLRYGPIDFS